MEMDIDELGNNQKLNLQIQHQIENTMHFFEASNFSNEDIDFERRIEFEPIVSEDFPKNWVQKSENGDVVSEIAEVRESPEPEKEIVLEESLLNNRRKNKESSSKDTGELSSNSELDVMIPEFVEGEPDFSKNHVCRKLNRFRCDNSQNYVTQCTRSFLTQQNVRELLLDCRKTISHFSYKRFLGEDYLPISSFGSRSKCIRMKEEKKKSTATCMETFCHQGGTSYSVMFPHLESIF